MEQSADADPQVAALESLVATMRFDQERTTAVVSSLESDLRAMREQLALLAEQNAAVLAQLQANAKSERTPTATPAVAPNCDSLRTIPAQKWRVASIYGLAATPNSPVSLKFGHGATLHVSGYLCTVSLPEPDGSAYKYTLFRQGSDEFVHSLRDFGIGASEVAKCKKQFADDYNSLRFFADEEDKLCISINM